MSGAAADRSGDAPDDARDAPAPAPGVGTSGRGRGRGRGPKCRDCSRNNRGGCNQCPGWLSMQLAEAPAAPAEPAGEVAADAPPPPSPGGGAAVASDGESASLAGSADGVDADSAGGDAVAATPRESRGVTRPLSSSSQEFSRRIASGGPSGRGSRALRGGGCARHRRAVWRHRVDRPADGGRGGQVRRHRARRLYSIHALG
mmetsp:Transcript_44071/g.143013  ORF Transcript_44071/g.143013 Transcript_44071/m.143013 type:complete len:202 (-) Transcript_44071:1115-1720(-)